jgi:CheY-like chemotaxis protein
MTVLVAEDENSIAYMYRVVLEHRNHEATITKDGQTCLETYLGTPNMKSRPSYDMSCLTTGCPGSTA